MLSMAGRPECACTERPDTTSDLGILPGPRFFCLFLGAMETVAGIVRDRRPSFPLLPAALLFLWSTSRPVREFPDVMAQAASRRKSLLPLQAVVLQEMAQVGKKGSQGDKHTRTPILFPPRNQDKKITTQT